MQGSDIKRAAGLAGGLIALLGVSSLPLGLDEPVARGLGIALLAATWWITEALPVWQTALVPLIALPALGILPARTVALSYADPLIFLFLGGFMIAQAMRSSDLDRSTARTTLALAGTRPSAVIGAFMLVTALLSAFISNTATAAMMLPIGLAVLSRAGLEVGSRFGKALLLGVAWSASIGGTATLIGTPPNVVLAGFARTILHREMDFTTWLVVGVPFAALMLPAAWAILLARYRPEVDRIETRVVRDPDPGRARARLVTGIVFAAVALLWVTHGFWKHVPVEGAAAAGRWLTDSRIAMGGGIALLALPARTRPYEPVLGLRDMARLPWGVLVLFGGGLALGNGLFESGAAAWIAGRLGAMAGLPVVALIAITCVMAMAITEVTSNTATANMLVPLVFALGAAAGLDPYLLALPAVLATSSAFMLPVATPPNAIVFGSGHVRMWDMVSTGILLNLTALAIIVLLTMLLTGPVLGIA
jgi:sodium-dependent dicarboxylate transporter 2/3/5